jgi:hypothetical protein
MATSDGTSRYSQKQDVLGAVTNGKTEGGKNQNNRNGSLKKN